jgi:hypothetical protein
MIKYCALFLVLAMLCQSCGVVTHTRYGNGFKLHIGENWGKGSGQTDPSISKKVKVDRDQHLNAAQLSKKEFKFLDSFNIHSIENTSPKKLRHKNKISLKSLKNPDVLSSAKNAQYNDLPMEPNIKLAGILFYGSILLSIILSSISNYSFIFLIFLELAGIFLSIFTLVAFILAIIGLGKIKRSGYAYRGRGLAISIIVIYVLTILLYLFILLLFLSIFL